MRITPFNRLGRKKTTNSISSSNNSRFLLSSLLYRAKIVETVALGDEPITQTIVANRARAHKK